MSEATPKQPWEARLREAASHAEDDLRRLVTYLNDEVVPDVRRNGSNALRAAAAELHRLAERMDEAQHSDPQRTGRKDSPPPPEPPPSSRP